MKEERAYEEKKQIDMYDCQHVSDYIHDISSSCLNLIYFNKFESAVCVPLPHIENPLVQNEAIVSMADWKLSNSKGS